MKWKYRTFVLTQKALLLHSLGTSLDKNFGDTLICQNPNFTPKQNKTQLKYMQFFTFNLENLKSFLPASTVSSFNLKAKQTGRMQNTEYQNMMELELKCVNLVSPL